MTDQPFAQWLLNSASSSPRTTVVGVFLACTAAYAFSASVPRPQRRADGVPRVPDVPRAR